MGIENLSTKEIKNGYEVLEHGDAFRCIVCGEMFKEGEIYPVGGRFFTASKAIEAHIQLAHPDYLPNLINSDIKYNTLTDNQKQLMLLFFEGLTDKEISKQMGISESTVRHQKFTFKEKAKQAKFYLGVYESVFERKGKTGTDLMPVHNGATMVDERYVITEKERDEVLKNNFQSLQPLVLIRFPRKEKKKVVVLTKIAEEFELGKQYTEKEVNEIIKPFYFDFVTLRRYLIEYGFMEREKDGSAYWVTNPIT